jgi:siroheme synthase
MMGLGQRDAIARAMAAAGWAAHTPVAVVLGASTAAADAWYGSLEGLGRAPLPIHDHAPGTIVIGAVAGLSMHLSATAAESEDVGASEMLRAGRTHVSHG